MEVVAKGKGKRDIWVEDSFFGLVAWDGSIGCRESGGKGLQVWHMVRCIFIAVSRVLGYAATRIQLWSKFSQVLKAVNASIFNIHIEI